MGHELTDKDICTFDPSQLNIKEKYEAYKPESLPIHEEFNVTSSLDKVQIFTRLNVEVSSSKIASQLMNTSGGGSNEKAAKILHSYDIVSASAREEKLLDLLIQKSDIDILTFDFCEFFKFFFNK